MKIIYFASIRETIGKDQEDIPLPDEVTTVSGLLDHLETRGASYKQAIGERFFVKAAINERVCDHADTITPDDEVSLFPPFTGG